MKYRCPQCKCTDHIDIAVRTHARLIQLPDGEVETDQGQSAQHDEEWDNSSYARCAACDYYGNMSTFENVPIGWKVEGRGDQFAIVDEDDVTVASLPYTDDGGGNPLGTEFGKRALVISASLELLAALDAVMKWWKTGAANEDEMPAEIFDAAHAALAKAKGGPQ